MGDRTGAFSLLNTSIDIALDSLKSVNQQALGAPDEMAQDEREAVSDVVTQLEILGKQVNILKRSLQKGGYIEKPNKRTRTEGENPGDVQPKLRDKAYADSVKQFQGTDKFLFGEFLRRICGTNPMKHSLDHALKCAVAGFQEGLTMEEVYEAIAVYAQYDDPDNSLAAVGDALVDASEDTAVATVYRVIQGSKDTFWSNGTGPWFHHMCGLLVHIWFALVWRELGSGAGSHKRKQERKEKIYKPTGPMTEQERDSEEFDSWSKRFEATRTACTHALDAYEVFGSIVIMHPGFSYAAFKCARRGPGLAGLTTYMRTALVNAEGNNPIRDNERRHQILLMHSLKTLSGELEPGLELLAKIEQKADRNFLGPVEEEQQAPTVE